MTIATIARTREAVQGLRICLIPGGFPDIRLEAAYQAFKKGHIDYLITAMRNSKEVGRELLERGVSEGRLLIPDESYFPYLSNLGDLKGAKTYLEDREIFQKIDSTKVVSQYWCAPRFLMTAWRLGYPNPSLIKAEDPRPLLSRKSFDIAEEWLADVPMYLSLAMINPDFYLESIEPKLQTLRRRFYSLFKK